MAKEKKNVLTDKEKARLNDLLEKAHSRIEGLNKDEIKELHKLFQKLTKEKEERINENESLSEVLERSSILFSCKKVLELAQVKEREEKHEWFNSLSLQKKHDFLESKVKELEKSPASKKAQKLSEQKKQQSFDEFYEAHAKKYGYSIGEAPQTPNEHNFKPNFEEETTEPAPEVDMDSLYKEHSKKFGDDVYSDIPSSSSEDIHEMDQETKDFYEEHAKKFGNDVW
ncbi:hypothetical protein ACJROX_10920 [Pseudalkalibacillus sp. A8]|uniref:hypothetical protein n=1 Tax=Pseudalkalibacillus sp. A8 TaxID=3382641 RepID=UPI0038B53EFF